MKTRLLTSYMCHVVFSLVRATHKLWAQVQVVSGCDRWFCRGYFVCLVDVTQVQREIETLSYEKKNSFSSYPDQFLRWGYWRLRRNDRKLWSGQMQRHVKKFTSEGNNDFILFWANLMLVVITNQCPPRNTHGRSVLYSIVIKTSRRPFLFKGNARARKK